MTATVINMECLAGMSMLLADNSIDAIVTDPPYGLSKQPDMAEVLRHWLAGDDYTHTGAGFMGKSWDSFVPGPSVWRECLRVLKPGGHLLAFAGTRTMDLMGLSLRLAGFELRDSIGYAHDGESNGAPLLAWVYGSGFPKNLDVSKAIDKAAGVERERHERPAFGGTFSDDNGATYGTALSNTPATDAAKQWAGWGTALKPSWEPILIARKPMAGTVAENVQQFGTGAINVDGCRIATDDGANRARPPRTPSTILGGGKGPNITASEHNETGRWPANLVHDGSEAVVALFPETSSGGYPPEGGRRTHVNSFGKPNARGEQKFKGSKGSAARFFYCAKASKRDRDEGCEALPVTAAADMVERDEGSDGMNSPRAGAGRTSGARNFHPTVKPTELMRWLVRLVTPPDGVVLDPFTGSGSTGKAAVLEGFEFMGFEMDPDYHRVAEARITHAERSRK